MQKLAGLAKFLISSGLIWPSWMLETVHLTYTYHMEDSCTFNRPESFDWHTLVRMAVTKATPLYNEIINSIVG